MIDKLQYRFRRVKVDPEAIEDIYDGQLYKEHSSPGGFLSDPNNISFLGLYWWSCTYQVNQLWSVARLPNT